VSLVNDGSAETNGTEKKTIIETSDGLATFTGAQEYELGGYLYQVQRVDQDPNQTDWEVAGTGKKSDPAEASVNAVVGNYLLNLAEQEQLSDRMSSLHGLSSDYGVWGRVYGGKFKSFDSAYLQGFSMKYSGLQLGLDHQIAATENGVWYIGGSVAYTSSDQDYRRGDGKQKSYSGTLYATYADDADWYVDLYLKYAHYRNKLDVLDSVGTNVTGRHNNNGFTLSAEVGKRFKFDNQFYMEPSAQLIYGHVGSNKIHNSNGLSVDLDSHKSTMLRLGSQFGYQGEILATPINFYATLAYVREFDGKQNYRLNGHQERIDLGGNWFEYGVGADIEFNEQNMLFFDIRGKHGNKFDHYTLNLGYKYRFE